MNRITSIMAMHTRDRVGWFVIPASVLGAGFVIALLITLLVNGLTGGSTPVYTGALASLYFVMLVIGVSAVTRTFPFAVGFGALRREYALGTLAIGAAFSAAWALLLGLLSLVEANLVDYWGVGLHLFHLPFFSDGAFLRQFCWSYYENAACARSDPGYVSGASSWAQLWVYFALLLFMYLLGLLIGSVYQRFGRVGAYSSAGVAVLLLSVFALLGTYLGWWSGIVGWLLQQTAASFSLWLLPPMALFALASYALLRKATV